jgi:hypothetical protein
LLESPTLDIASNPGESERDFRVRLQQIAREQRDEAVEKLRRKYAPKFEQLEERKRRAEQAVARETEQAKGQKMQTAISFGATLLSSFLGRKRTSLSTLGRATTAVRGVGRSMKESQDVDRAEDNVSAITQKLADLEAEFQAETAALERSLDPQTEQLEKVSLKPTKANIAVKLAHACLGALLARRTGRRRRRGTQTGRLDYEAQTGVHIEIAEFPYTNLFEKELIDLKARTGAYDLIMLDDPWFPRFATDEL